MILGKNSDELTSRRPKARKAVANSLSWKDFHFEEYRALKSDMSSYEARLATNVQWSAAFSVAVYAFLLAARYQDLKLGIIAIIGWWIPTVTTFAGMFLSVQIVLHIDATGKYLKEVENRYGHPDLGWQKFIEDVRTANHKVGRARVGTTAYRSHALRVVVALWVLLVLVNGGIAIFGSGGYLPQPLAVSSTGCSYARPL